MKQYLEMMGHVMSHGRDKADRTGTGTRSVFGHDMRFDLTQGFPLLTTKALHFKSIAIELLWFLSGSTNTKFLTDNGVTIWNEWANEKGELGPVYGHQWRKWFVAGRSCGPLSLKTCAEGIESIRRGGMPIVGDHIKTIVHEARAGKDEVRFTSWGEIDQIAQVMESLKNNPDSRRHIVSAWNPADIHHMALPPCHMLFQFYVDDLTEQERLVEYKRLQGLDLLNDLPEGHAPDENGLDVNLDISGVPRKRLNCKLTQRSADTFLGVPYNIASYALLTHMFAHQLGYAVGDFIWSGGDVHLYRNHMEQAELQLTREPRPLPTLSFARKPSSIFDYTYEDFVISGYDPHPHIAGKVAV